MIIKGLGEFKLTGAINKCEPLLKILRLSEYSYKPHMMVTYDEESGYYFHFYDDDDPARIVLRCEMTLDENEKHYIKTCKWY